jgi:hypothetical protein
MSKQSNKAEKRKRRQAYLKRRKARLKTKSKASALPPLATEANPQPVA